MYSCLGVEVSDGFRRVVSALPMSVLLSGPDPHRNVSQAEAKGRAQPHKLSPRPRQGGRSGPDTRCPPVLSLLSHLLILQPSLICTFPDDSLCPKHWFSILLYLLFICFTFSIKRPKNFFLNKTK